MGRSITAIEKLKGIIPVENVETYLRIYQKIKEIEYNDSFDTLKDLSKEMRRLLTKAKDRGWLGPEEKTSIWELWSSFLFNKIDLPKILLDVLKDEYRGQRHRPTENHVNFLIYALYFDLNAFTKRPNYPLIADVLGELDPRNCVTYDNVRKRLKTISSSKLRLDLTSYQDYFQALGDPLLPDNIPANPTGFLRELYRDLLGRIIPEDLERGNPFSIKIRL